MTELTIRPEEIRDALARFVEEYQPDAASRGRGRHGHRGGDGIARVEGLPSAMANELLEFPDGTRGLALNLDVREIGVVILGDFSKIEEGQQVRRTGEVLSVPVGDGFLGRVVDPLGVPLDGLGEITGTELRELEIQAPTVVQRKKVHEPMQTGIKAIDAITPIGRGQRELIIGDRQTGKTAIGIDTIINQKANWDVGRPGAAGPLHLRRDRPEGLDHRPGPPVAGGRGRAGVHHDRGRARVRPGRLQVHRALHRVGHRPALDVRRQARPDHLRRPVQAGRGLPGRVAAAAPPAGPRGLPRRRLLPALAAAGALRQAVRRDGRGLDDRAAGRSRPRPTTSRPTSRPTSSRSPTARSSWSPTCSTPVSGRPSTSAGRCPGSAATRRSRR